MGLTRLKAYDPMLAEVHKLIHASFAFMDGVVHPPSSVHALTMATLRHAATAGEVWAAGTPLHACAIFTPEPEALYIGKLCVAADARGQGHARHLVAHAATRARELNLRALEVQVRVELTGNHAAFTAMGFAEVGRTSHEGYDRPTSITYRKPV